MSTSNTASVAVNPYAPPAAPTDQPRPRPTEGGGFRSATPLARAVMGVMALIALVKAAAIFNQILMIGLMNRVLGDGHFEAAELATVQQRATITALAALLLLLTAPILFCPFVARANRNARAFRGGPMQFTPGWSVGVFFVPIWNFYKPYFAMKEIWQESDPNPSTPSLLVAAPKLLSLWWFAFIAQAVANQIATVGWKGRCRCEQFESGVFRAHCR